MIVSNKVFPRHFKSRRIPCTYTMMMQLKVVAVWVFLLVSIAGLTEGKFTVTNIQLHMLLCMREADSFIQFGVILWGIPVSYEWCI